jgi:hypothetical protein
MKLNILKKKTEKYEEKKNEAGIEPTPLLCSGKFLNVRPSTLK